MQALGPIINPPPAEKFLDCAAFAKWPLSKAKSVVEMTRGIEKIPNIRQLTALLG
jgi:hypothetical protein